MSNISLKKKFIKDNRLIKSNDHNSNFLNIDALKLMIEKDSELVHKIDKNSGSSLLMSSVSCNNFQIAELLLEKSVDPDLQNIYGETALHMAVENGNHKIINLLLEKGANPNIQQQDGETPMHLAALKGDYKVIKLLLLYGANPLLSTFVNGYYSIDYAQERGHNKCIQVLKPLMEKKESTICQTHKNSESPIYKFKNNIDFTNPAVQSSRNNSVTTVGISFSTKAGQIPHHGRTKSHNFKKQPNDYFDENDSLSFINQMNNFEERLERMKKELNQIENLSHLSTHKNEESYHTAPPMVLTPSSKYYSSRNDKFTMFGNYIINATPHLPSSSKYNTHQLMNFTAKSSQNNENSHDIKNFTLNNLEDNLRGLKAEEMTEIYENQEMSRITYATANNDENLFNIKNHNYSLGYSKVNDSYWNDLEINNYKKTYLPIVEKFIDNSKVLAIFPSCKNDILDYDTIKAELDENMRNGTEVKSIKYFSKTSINKDEYNKQISIDTESNNTVEIDYNEEIKTKEETQKDFQTNDANRQINDFLKSIDMEVYFKLFIKNGFDDLELLLDGIKDEMIISDENLKGIGIYKPGHRAKILLKLESDSKLLGYILPNIVFYNSNIDIEKVTIDNLIHDVSIKNIYNWLKILKLENYTINFVRNGYHSLDLLYCQINSSNPITEKILEEEVGIQKIGYRIRILNKLKEDSKIYIKKIKNKQIIISDKNEGPESCKCVIY